ncbi:hypothetical protein Misp06_01100 [Microbulbifer sp. NBRC 101763]|uniref:hypothetical protein n=1 Tax=Microbulbifer TaxID=48073 RepID=UPI00035D573C|nr:hypothetical protein [Microbulbifer variabilis]
MDTNIYSAPEAELHTEFTEEFDFYVVSSAKFWVMNLGTMGLYSVYWFYRQWREYKRASGESLWPVMRAIFSIFFTHSLFIKIQSHLEEAEIEYKWRPKLMAAIYIVLAILGSIIDRISYLSDEFSLIDIFSPALLPLTVWPLFEGQKAANTLSGDISGKVNAKLTPLNFLWLGVGALLWAIVVFGAYIVISGE